MRITFVLFFTGVLLGGCQGTDVDDGQNAVFERRIVHETESGAAPWAKFAGDVTGDNLPEVLIGFHGSKRLLAVSPVTGQEQVLVDGYAVMTDGEIGDIDGDGVNDIVIPTEQGLLILQGPDWRAETISDKRLHDVEVVDLNLDGELEIVARNQTAFGSGNGDILLFSRAGHDGTWNEEALPVPEGEGFVAADLDADGDPDIVANSVWFENKLDGTWHEHRYTESWDWPHVKVAVADINDDGRVDIVLAPSELEGSQYRVSWFNAPEDRRAPWREQVLVRDIETVVHSLQAGDIDLDGDVDLVYAEMHQGQDPDEVVLLENRNNGDDFIKRIVDEGGSHNLQVLDFDGDGDQDMVGANWSGPEQDVMLWENSTCTKPWSNWRRHLVDGDRPGRAVFIFANDFNGDLYPDLATGAFLYVNPGYTGNEWRRVRLGSETDDVIFATDVDDDGDTDLLATAHASGERHFFAVYRNDGTGEFQFLDTGVSMTGDFLQGSAKGRFSENGESFALSWHGAGAGIEMLHMPDSAGGPWSLDRISDFSQDEAVSTGDIDRDGVPDLYLGTAWLRNNGDSWSRHAVDDTKELPDRNRLADLDGDGDLDAVVGFQAISKLGDLVWYESPADPQQKWTRHLIGRIVGPMSLDLADMDGDDDLDIVIGEHNLEDPADAALWVFENLDGRAGKWDGHRIHIGDEHHDGAQTVDVDLDGDQDIVSIGWGHNEVIWYENRVPACPET